jgi:hypothetical protein
MGWLIGGDGVKRLDEHRGCVSFWDSIRQAVDIRYTAINPCTVDPPGAKLIVGAGTCQTTCTELMPWARGQGYCGTSFIGASLVPKGLAMYFFEALVPDSKIFIADRS